MKAKHYAYPINEITINCADRDITKSHFDVIPKLGIVKIRAFTDMKVDIDVSADPVTQRAMAARLHDIANALEKLSPEAIHEYIVRIT